MIGEMRYVIDRSITIRLWSFCKTYQIRTNVNVWKFYMVFQLLQFLDLMLAFLQALYYREIMITVIITLHLMYLKKVIDQGITDENE